MILPNNIIESLKLYFDKGFEPKKTNSVGGGSINHAASFELGGQQYFIKWNKDTAFPEMFEKESSGLNLLAEANCLDIPKVLHHDKSGDLAYLLLEYLQADRKSPDFWEDFGKGLAKLHRNTNDSYGLDHNNYIGSLFQRNDFRNSWSEFFIEMRLEPMISMAYNSSLLSKSTVSSFERFYKRIEDIFPKEAPALIHGDLWSGNYMIGPEGKAYIIDPAVYYGHREMDLGMSKLFGGFSSEFYSFYHEEYPLEHGWESRIDLCNLYPLLVHVNLFGFGYVRQVESIIRRF